MRTSTRLNSAGVGGGGGGGGGGGVRLGRQKKRVRALFSQDPVSIHYPVVKFIRSQQTSKSARRATLVAACASAEGERHDHGIDGGDTPTYAYAEDMWAIADGHHKLITAGDRAVLTELMAENTSASGCRVFSDSAFSSSGSFCVVPPPVPVESLHPACWGLQARSIALAAVANAAASSSSSSSSAAFSRVHPAAASDTTLVPAADLCVFSSQHAAALAALANLEAANVHRIGCLAKHAESSNALDVIRLKRRRLADVLAFLIGDGEDAEGFNAAAAGGAGPGTYLELGPCLEKHVRRGPWLTSLTVGDAVEVCVGYDSGGGTAPHTQHGHEKWRPGVIAECRCARGTSRSFRVRMMGSFEGDWVNVSAEESLLAPPGTHLSAHVFRAHGVAVAVPAPAPAPAAAEMPAEAAVATALASTAVPADAVQAAVDLLAAAARRRQTTTTTTSTTMVVVHPSPTAARDRAHGGEMTSPRGAADDDDDDDGFGGRPLSLFGATDGNSGGIPCSS